MINIPNNYLKYPDNIFPEENIEINDRRYTIYKMRFNNLEALYHILKENPQVNDSVFSELSSVKDDFSFAGKPYEEALEDLVKDIDPEYEEFLTLQKELNNIYKREIHKYQTVKTVGGGKVNIHDYTAGAPLCYETEEKVVAPKFAKMYITLSYSWNTTKDAVYNRAIITTNLLNALESAGYRVDVNTFELSIYSDELFYANLNVKKQGGYLNNSDLYKSLCHVEFLRRILFRLLEISDVKNDWKGGSYGRTCSEGMSRKVLKMNKNDIFIDQPYNLGIRGDDLADDFENAINLLQLSDKIDVEKAKQEFRKSINVLSERKKDVEKTEQEHKKNDIENAKHEFIKNVKVLFKRRNG